MNKKKPESYDGIIGQLVIKHLGANLYKTKDLIDIRNLALEFSDSYIQEAKTRLKSTEKANDSELQIKDRKIDELKFHVKKLEDLVFAKDGVILELRPQLAAKDKEIEKLKWIIADGLSTLLNKDAELQDAKAEVERFAEWIAKNYFVAYSNSKMFYKDGKDHSVKEIYKIFKSQLSQPTKKD